MNIIETIQKRHSVRTYTGEPLRQEHTAQIKQYINQLQVPFGKKARIEWVGVNTGEKPIKPGTYGFIKGASAYLALIYEEDDFAATAAAYMFEQVILFCTNLGLGTCWLGGSFSRNDFKKQIKPNADEILKIVSPVGYPSDKKRWLEKILNTDRKHISRKPFEELFFDKDFDHPLSETQAGIFLTPLKMVRLAPSANNKQEWRAVIEDKTLHFYKKPFLKFDSIDIGIALCHFELTCKELGIEGQFEKMQNHPANDSVEYVISWIQK
jgi:nitroreductase